MSTSLQGKVAIVTGSSRSIGASIAKRLAEDGANVVVNYVSNLAAANEVVDAINSKRDGAAVAVKADVSTTIGRQYLLDEGIRVFGRLDILVLNAGIMGSKVIAHVDEAFFDSHMEINVKGPFFLAKAAIPHLLKSEGRLIFFSSSLTRASTVLPNAVTYVATKGAIEQISRVLAKDLGAHHGVTVNTVSPGPVDTDLFREGKSDQVINFIAGSHPQKRLAMPDDIAPVVSFLASPAARWVNGQNILVNGGFAL